MDFLLLPLMDYGTPDFYGPSERMHFVMVLLINTEISREGIEMSVTSILRYVLIDLDRIAFMFNGAPFPALSIHPIVTNICMRHLWLNI